MTETAKEQSTLRALWTRACRRPAGRWPGVRWGLALLVPLALLLWALSALLAPDDPDLLRITVESQATGNAIEGAAVTVGDLRYLTDASGAITIDPVSVGTEVLVSADGHESTRAETGEDGEDLIVSLSAVLVVGSVTDIVSGMPVADATLQVLDSAGNEVASTHTDESGGFVFKFIPEDAELAVSHDVYGDHLFPLDDRRSLFVQLDPPPVTGRVVDASGAPVSGATVTGPQVSEESDEEGTFTIEGVGQGTELLVAAGGIGEARIEVRGGDLGDIRIPAAPATPTASPATVEVEG